MLWRRCWWRQPTQTSATPSPGQQCSQPLPTATSRRCCAWSSTGRPGATKLTVMSSRPCVASPPSSKHTDSHSPSAFSCVDLQKVSCALPDCLAPIHQPCLLLFLCITVLCLCVIAQLLHSEDAQVRIVHLYKFPKDHTRIYLSRFILSATCFRFIHCCCCWIRRYNMKAAQTWQLQGSYSLNAPPPPPHCSPPPPLFAASCP